VIIDLFGRPRLGLTDSVSDSAPLTPPSVALAPPSASGLPSAAAKLETLDASTVTVDLLPLPLVLGFSTVCSSVISSREDTLLTSKSSGTGSKIVNPKAFSTSSFLTEECLCFALGVVLPFLPEPVITPPSGAVTTSIVIPESLLEPRLAEAGVSLVDVMAWVLGVPCSSSFV